MSTMRKRSARTIKVSDEAKKKLAKMFNCTERMVYKALCFEGRTLLTKKIQYVALKELGGWVEASVPESEIFYDTMSNGEHIMRQYFENGAVFEASLDSGCAIVRFKGETVSGYESVKLNDIPGIQNYAQSLR